MERMNVAIHLTLLFVNVHLDCLCHASALAFSCFIQLLVVNCPFSPVHYWHFREFYCKLLDNASVNKGNCTLDS